MMTFCNGHGINFFEQETMERLYSYRSLQGLAKFLIVLISFGIIVSLVSISFELMQIQLIEELINGADITQEQLAASDSRKELIVFSEIALNLITSFVFLRWVYVSATNAQSFSDRMMTHSPGWCVGWFFIPFLNLVRPFQAMTEIWQVSEVQPGERWRDAPTPPILGFWWALWILGAILVQVSNYFTGGAEAAAEFQVADWASIAASVERIVLDIVVIVMIHRLVGIQEQRSRMTEISGDLARCPACGETIDPGSRVCPMCGKDLPGSQGNEVRFENWE
jgi:Domain of unknown function (DUF4328)/zinc-ribbon domain